MQSELWELRRYRAAAGRAGDLERRFHEAAIPAFRRQGMDFRALWRSTEEPEEFWYLLRFESAAEGDEAWERFRADPLWQEAKSSSEAAGPLVVEHGSTLLGSLTEIGISEGGSNNE